MPEADVRAAEAHQIGNAATNDCLKIGVHSIKPLSEPIELAHPHVHGCITFRVARDLSTVAAKREDHLPQADL
jgi:hypothetical protein